LPFYRGVRWIYLIEKYRTITNICGTVLVSWILSAIAGQAIGLLLPEPKGIGPRSNYSASLDPRSLALAAATTRRLDYYMPICERNIFDSLKRTPCMEEEGPIEEGVRPADLDSEPVKSDINAKLLGTTVSTNPNFSFATIAPKKEKKSQNYYVDDVLMEEARLYDVQRNIVFFVRNGRREFIQVDSLPAIYKSRLSAAVPVPAASSGGVKREGNKVIISREKVEATLGDLNKIIQQARMVPHFEGGQVKGFKIFAIRPNSIFQQLGLKNGDVIQRINGTEINSVEKAIPMLQMARNESNISIDLTRRGAKQTLSIEIR